MSREDWENKNIPTFSADGVPTTPGVMRTFVAAWMDEEVPGSKEEVAAAFEKWLGYVRAGDL